MIAMQDDNFPKNVSSTEIGGSISEGESSVDPDPVTPEEEALQMKKIKYGK